MPIVGSTTPQMNTPMTPVTKSHRGTMLGLPVETVSEWANRLYIVFTVIAIAGAALALIASFFMWRTGSILTRLSDEKIAALSKDAADARLEQEKLRAQLAGRRINKETYAHLIQSLGATHHSIILQTMMDGEATIYAADWKKVFEDAGWTIAGTEFPVGEVWHGLILFNSQSDQEAVELIRNTLMTLNIPFNVANNRTAAAPTLLIGAKPPPF